MATLLTTSKMHPALKARVDASVRGRRKRPGSTFGPRVVALLRIGALFAFLGLAGWLTLARTRIRQDVEQARTALLDEARVKSATMTPSDFDFVARVNPWIMHATSAYEGDVFTDDVRDPAAFAAILARPIVYLRGPIGVLGSAPGIVDTASTSAKDPFVLCLLDPPSARTEKVMLSKVKLAYAGGAPIEQATSNVRRLHEAILGLPVLTPAWAARVQGAQDIVELGKLRREFERAPTDRAKLAVRSELLLFAVDEIGDGPTELDGERAHGVRITLVELATSRVLLRMRRVVDPKWISVPMRPEFSMGLDGCGLAVDVREAARVGR